MSTKVQRIAKRRASRLVWADRRDWRWRSGHHLRRTHEADGGWLDVTPWSVWIESIADLCVRPLDRARQRNQPKATP